MAQAGKIFSGDLYGRQYGSDDGFALMGNVTELSTSTEVETKELIGTGKNNYGQAISAITIPQPTEISIKFNSFDKDGIARALMGEASIIGKSAQTITETTTKGSKINWVKLSHQNIDPDNFTVKNKSSAPVDKEHYELNAQAGLIRFLDTASITEGDNFTYSGKTLATSGYSVDANSLHSFELELLLDAQDKYTGANATLHIPHAVISSDGDINWLSDDWIENGLSGKLIKDDNQPTMRFTEFTA